METNLIEYSRAKKVVIVLFVVVVIAIPTINYVADPVDFRRRFWDSDRWMLPIFVAAILWLMYATVIPALKHWSDGPGWIIRGDDLIAPDGTALPLEKIRKVEIRSHFLRHETVVLWGEQGQQLGEVFTGFRTGDSGNATSIADRIKIAKSESARKIEAVDRMSLAR